MFFLFMNFMKLLCLSQFYDSLLLWNLYMSYINLLSPDVCLSELSNRLLSIFCIQLSVSLLGFVFALFPLPDSLLPSLLSQRSLSPPGSFSLPSVCWSADLLKGSVFRNEPKGNFIYFSISFLTDFKSPLSTFKAPNGFKAFTSHP